MLLALRGFDDDAAADDPVMVLGKLGRFLTDSGLDGIGMFDVSESDFDWDGHGSLSFSFGQLGWVRHFRAFYYATDIGGISELRLQT